MELIKITNAELVEDLTRQLAERDIKDGAIVSLIGAADAFTISTMPKDNAALDNISHYTWPAEMHGTGEIVDGKPHIHVTMAVEGDQALSGHLHQAKIGHWFANVYVERLG